MKPGGASKPSKSPPVRQTSYPCPLRGCGRVHVLCVDGEPAADAMLTYVCPVTHRPTGFRFGELEWREVETCPEGSIVMGRPK
jgi:hypothetical protein